MKSRRRAQAEANAWEIHRVMMDWTTRVDTKAAFALTIQTAIVAAVAALTAADAFGAPRSWLETSLLVLGLALLIAGAVVAAVVVAPKLRPESLVKESRVDHIYFGHVRNLSAIEISQRLSQRELLPVLSRQIVRMAEMLWVKHVRVLWAIWLGISGGLVLTVMLGLHFLLPA